VKASRLGTFALAAALLGCVRAATSGAGTRPNETATTRPPTVSATPHRRPMARPTPDPLAWPTIGRAQRPWTRWWWPGSAVDDTGLTAAMEAYHQVGLGGVEITPIYGVAGTERRFIDYLSPRWMARLEHTLREAARLRMGVDMATGTGWPWGGPTVGPATEAKDVVYRTYHLVGGERLEEPVRARQEPLLRLIGNHVGAPLLPDSVAGRGGGSTRRPTLDDLSRPLASTPRLQALALEQVRFPDLMPLQALVAYPDSGEPSVLTDRVGDDGMLDWTAPPGTWTLWAVFQGWHGKTVERAAPGGEGYVLDPFSQRAVQDYLAHFSHAFEDHDVSGLRAFFNDSYEVDDAQGEADWTPRLFDEFQARRGYDLREHLPALFGRGDSAEASRVLTDYRQTISDLLLDHFTRQWRRWAAARGDEVRDQAHGSPGNILDLYAAADIPETEGTEILRFKFASSAAHVTGKPLASAESATWLNEHFLSSLADVKEAVDRYFLGGVNHIVYHGTAYSPPDAPWPGWLFYAAVHFSPTNPLWNDFGTLNEYVARTQSILQRGRPDDDVLLYLPIFDRYAVRDRSLLVHFDGLTPFRGMRVADDAALLESRGYTFDFVSDRQLRGVSAADARLKTGGAFYRTVVVPDARLVPLATLEKLIELARSGATIVVHGRLPRDVPGLHHRDARRFAFQAALGHLTFSAPGAHAVRVAHVGDGLVVLGDDLEGLLARAQVRRETMVDDQLGFVRRAREDGIDYFIADRGAKGVDGWVPLATPAAFAAIFNPMTGATGVAKLGAGKARGSEIYLQIPAGGSVIVRTFDHHISGPDWPYARSTGASIPLDGTWRLHFDRGGPVSPPDQRVHELGSWTALDGEATRDFSGTATYTLTFERPTATASRWRLDLGVVHESARVRLNGRELGTLIGPTYALIFGDDRLRSHNVLEVDVSNLMANRIAAMDRAKVPWKRFYNVDFPPHSRANAGPGGLFDASGWSPRPSGLFGPVTLTPVASF